MTEVYTKDTCRLCNSSDMTLVLPLQSSPLCDAYVAEKKAQTFYPLNVFFCDRCGFVQIDTIIDPEIIYRDYIYVTTSSSGLRNHFQQYANEVCDRLNLNNSNLTIDIGSNDGTLLSFFKAKGHRVLGIEPATKIAEEATANGLETLPDFFNEKLAEKIVSQYGHGSLITINNLFANIDNLTEFIRGIDRVLAHNGVLVIESSYLLDMIENMVFDFIYHEHLSYFSILPLIQFFQQFKMRLIDLQEIPTKGGSLRYYWAREESKWNINPAVEKAIAREKQANIGIETFKNFEVRINTVKEESINFLQSQSDKTIVGYGASATSTTLIAHFQLQQYFSYLVDDNPGKVETYSPGYHIPVYGFKKLQESPPDIIMILAWRYKEQILKKLLKLPSQVIVPLPTFEILRQ